MTVSSNDDGAGFDSVEEDDAMFKRMTLLYFGVNRHLAFLLRLAISLACCLSAFLVRVSETVFCLVSTLLFCMHKQHMLYTSLESKQKNGNLTI